MIAFALATLVVAQAHASPGTSPGAPLDVPLDAPLDAQERGAQELAADTGAAHDAADVDTGAWCARALPLAHAPPPASGTERAAYDALALMMPREATPVVARARELAGEEGYERSMAVLRFAILDACASGVASMTNDEASAQAVALMNDARFSGIRKGDGTFDRLMH